METYYQRNRERRLAYSKRYYLEHKEQVKKRLAKHPEKQKKWRAEHPDSIKRYKETHAPKQKLYYEKWYAENGRSRTEHDKEKILEWITEHPDRVKIQQQLCYHIRKGKFTRPDICPRCGRKTRIHAHHIDYKHYSHFIWLCVSCHKLEHRSFCT